jgi:thioredoxin 1
VQQPAGSAEGNRTRIGGKIKVSDLIVHTTDADFDADVIRSEEPVLLDFWAEWCGPCRMIAPILDEIASEHQGELRIVKLNIDENPQTPAKFNIRSIPTLLLFNNGSVAAQQVGAVSKAQLESFLGQHLASA